MEKTFRLGPPYTNQISESRVLRTRSSLMCVLAPDLRDAEWFSFTLATVLIRAFEPGDSL